jgi:hypothetical protein
VLHEDDRIVRLRRVLPQVAAIVWLPACFVFGLFNREFLPEKYFYDDGTIQKHLSRSASASEDTFRTMAALYEFLGAAGHPRAVAAVTMLVFFLLLLRCASWNDLMHCSWYETAVFCLSAVAGAVYLAQYSKESLILLLVLILVWLPRHVALDMAFVGLCCAYAYFVREYWFLVAGLFLALRTTLATTRRALLLPLAMVAALFAFAYGIEIVLGVDLNSFRDQVAEWRVNSQDAQTEIRGYLPTDSPDLAAANAALTLLLLVVPVPLLLNPSLTYIAFTVAISSMWLALAATMFRYCRSGHFVRDHRSARAAALLLAMVTVQAVFEPDYGSYLKHLTPLLPLFLVVLVRRRRFSSDTEFDPAPPSWSARTVTRITPANHQL